MHTIREQIDVDRSPEDVYAYAVDPDHLPDWQLSALAAERLDEGPLHTGSRVRVTRRVGSREVPMTMELTEHEPPYSWRVQGIDGPVRAFFHGEIEPLEGGRRSRVTLELDFVGHGIGRALVPFVVRPQVRRELPRNEQRLKERLEGMAV
ncbi:SRPBCC family protein [Streptomyces sp. NPDC057877]|uniref:SRPBCC family protein n=1 Tax=Streptomyces sp. NPDC057877 TaxID=3346269 RepID=UPI0036CF840C